MERLSQIDDIINRNAEISDEDMLIKKGLLEGNELNADFYNFNDKYYTLYKNYKKLLDMFLLAKFSLKEYDDRVENSGLKFVPVKKEDMDYYQYISNMGLKYFYLRNNLYIEKLDEKDIDVLINLSQEQLANPNKEIMDIIERTYLMVIDFASGKGMPSMSCYGLDYDEYWHDSSELVFGFIFDDFADNGLGQDELWQENYFKQTRFINELLAEMNKKISEAQGKNVNFIRYNEFTIKESALSR